MGLSLIPAVAGHGTRVVVDAPRFSDRLDLYIVQYTNAAIAARKMLVPVKVDMQLVSEDAEAQPVISMSNLTSAAQELADSLWRAGVRPKDAAGSVGQLSAVEAHLQDMRRLAFEAPAAPTRTNIGIQILRNENTLRKAVVAIESGLPPEKVVEHIRTLLVKEGWM